MNFKYKVHSFNELMEEWSKEGLCDYIDMLENALNYNGQYMKMCNLCCALPMDNEKDRICPCLESKMVGEVNKWRRLSVN